MKCVDIIAEFEEVYVFVELKDYDDSSFFGSFGSGTDDEKTRHAKLNTLKNYLKYKFRDSYLFRYAEQKVDKPIRYICLITFENALNSRIQKSLKRELPVGKASQRWVRELAISCHVVNLNRWNKNFPNWPVSRIPAPT